MTSTDCLPLPPRRPPRPVRLPPPPAFLPPLGLVYLASPVVATSATCSFAQPAASTANSTIRNQRRLTTETTSFTRSRIGGTRNGSTEKDVSRPPSLHA